MKLLTLEKSMRAAITLVTKLKLPFLAEKFSSILEVIYKNFHFLFIAQNRRKIIYIPPLLSLVVMLIFWFFTNRKGCLKKLTRQ